MPFNVLFYKMVNQYPLYLLIIGTQIANAFGSMYEAYTIEPADFVVNTTSKTMTDSGQMTQFMCSVNAAKNGHTAFRISNDTGICEMGSINNNAIASPTGIEVFVESSITINKCVISPTIDSEMNSPTSGQV